MSLGSDIVVSVVLIRVQHVFNHFIMPFLRDHCCC